MELAVVRRPLPRVDHGLVKEGGPGVAVDARGRLCEACEVGVAKADQLVRPLGTQQRSKVSKGGRFMVDTRALLQAREHHHSQRPDVRRTAVGLDRREDDTTSLGGDLERLQEPCAGAPRSISGLGAACILAAATQPRRMLRRRCLPSLRRPSPPQVRTPPRRTAILTVLGIGNGGGSGPTCLRSAAVADESSASQRPGGESMPFTRFIKAVLVVRGRFPRAQLASVDSTTSGVPTITHLPLMTTVATAGLPTLLTTSRFWPWSTLLADGAAVSGGGLQGPQGHARLSNLPISITASLGCLLFEASYPRYQEVHVACRVDPGLVLDLPQQLRNPVL